MTQTTDLADALLLRRMAGGDEEAFAEVYRQKHPAIFRFALHMTGNSAVAEDVTQEVFMALIRDPKRFDPTRGSLGGFLFGVARNHLRKRWEQDRRLVSFDGDPDDLRDTSSAGAGFQRAAGGKGANFNGKLPRGGGSLRAPGDELRGSGVGAGMPGRDGSVPAASGEGHVGGKTSRTASGA